MTYPYYPPNCGKPEPPKLSWAILWLLSQGVTDGRTIRETVGCSSRYVGLVKSRYRARGAPATLKTLQKINTLWETPTMYDPNAPTQPLNPNHPLGYPDDQPSQAPAPSPSPTLGDQPCPECPSGDCHDCPCTD